MSVIDKVNLLIWLWWFLVVVDLGIMFTLILLAIRDRRRK